MPSRDCADYWCDQSRGSYSKWTFQIYERIDRLVPTSVWSWLEPFFNQTDIARWTAKSFISRRIRDHQSKFDGVNEPLRMLGAAAKRGDIHAQFLWCSYVTFLQKAFSREEWEQYLEYGTELVSAGGIYSWDYWIAGSGKNSFIIEDYFYQSSSKELVEEWVRKERRKERKRLIPSLSDDWGLSRMEIPAALGTGFLDRELVHNEEGKQLLYRLFEEAALKGHPLAQARLAGLLNRGDGCVPDAVRSWSLLIQAKGWFDRINAPVIYDSNRMSVESFEEMINRQMVNMVSLHGEMPGMTEREAFDVLMKMQHEDKFGFDKEKNLILRERFEARGIKLSDDPK